MKVHTCFDHLGRLEATTKYFEKNEGAKVTTPEVENLGGPGGLEPPPTF